MNNHTRPKSKKKLLNQLESKGNIQDIKCDYLLQELFNMIPKKNLF